jgi:hypothetical protein
MLLSSRLGDSPANRGVNGTAREMDALRHALPSPSQLNIHNSGSQVPGEFVGLSANDDVIRDFDF